MAALVTGALTGALTGCTPSFTPVGSAATGLPVPGTAVRAAVPDTDWGTQVALAPVVVRATSAPRAAATTSRAVPTTLAPLPRDPAKHRQCTAHVLPRHVGLTTTAGTRSISATWYSDGDPEVRSFRVAALDQDATGAQPPPVWRGVAQSSGCRSIGTTLSGLVSGHTYVVWLDAVTVDPEEGGATETMVGSSGAVVVR